MVKKTKKLVEFDNINNALNTQLLKYKRIQNPITILESEPLHTLGIDLRSGVFILEKLKVVAKVPNHLRRILEQVDKIRSQGKYKNSFIAPI